jgi:hypothetical protein
MFGLAAFFIFWLAVVPNLPTLREVHFITMFEMGPFQGWQQAFSTKSAVSWLDRDTLLGGGMARGFAPTTLNGGTYLGLVTFFILALALAGRSLEGSVAGRQSRVFIGLAMFAFWLSFGPRSVLGGHMEFLGLSMEAADFLPALGWFLLAGQVWILFRLLAPKGNLALALATGISIVYLVVPGFRLLELVPLYKNIRAPFDFFQVTGAICIIAGSAMAAGILLEGLPWRIAKMAAATVLVLFAAWDATPYARSIFQPQMDRAVFNDFLETQKFLKSAPQSGRVYAFSGRYFYLLTPWISGRPLANEAFNSYLQQRACVWIEADVYVPGLTDGVGGLASYAVFAEAQATLDGVAMPAERVSFLGRFGNDFRYRFELPKSTLFYGAKWSRYEYAMRFSTDGRTWTNDVKRTVVRDASFCNPAWSSCAL